MASFQVRFTRYNSKTRDRRISGTQHMHGSFEEVYQRAQHMIAGMKAADPISDFHLVGIETHEFRGTDCEGGSLLFETAEELSARVAAQNATPPRLD